MPKTFELNYVKILKLKLNETNEIMYTYIFIYLYNIYTIHIIYTLCHDVCHGFPHLKRVSVTLT